MGRAFDVTPIISRLVLICLPLGVAFPPLLPAERIGIVKSKHNFLVTIPSLAGLAKDEEAPSFICCDWLSGTCRPGVPPATVVVAGVSLLDPPCVGVVTCND